MSKNGVAISEMEDGESHNYELTRPAGKLETVFQLYSELGVQSVVINTATYSQGKSDALGRKTLYPALQSLISEHYALRLTNVVRPAERQPDLSCLWEAQVHSINLDRLVEFIEADEGDNLHDIIEATHNEWLDLRDHDLPLWRLKVVNGRHILFIYSHTVADGLSGYAFHRGLLRRLNRSTPNTDQPTHVFEPPPVPPPQLWTKDFPVRLSILQVVWDVLFMYFVRFFLGSKMMFHDVPIDTKVMPITARYQNTKPCQTKLHTLRLSSPFQKDILAACKRNKVTFTSLLHTVTVMTAATDLYPNATLGLTATALSIRPYAKPKQSSDLLVNSASMNIRLRRLQRYRDAAKASPTNSKESKVTIDPEKTWALTQDYLRHFRRGLDTHAFYNGLLAMDLSSKEMENLFKQTFPNLWLYQRHCTSVSNLGPFDPDLGAESKPHENKGWTITDIQFSTAAVRSNWGFCAPVFNVGGVRGGDCTIHAVIEEGVLSDSTMQIMLANIEQRLRFLVEHDKLQGGTGLVK